jgi:hypothetical protein
MERGMAFSPYFGSWTILSIVVATATSQVAVIGERGFRVGVNDLGVLVSAPPGGLVTADAPRVVLAPRPRERYLVSYDGPNGRVSGVASGNLPDVTPRTAIVPVSFVATQDQAQAITKLGDLEIRSECSFTPSHREVVVTAVLTNRGTAPLANLQFVREWQVRSLQAGAAPPAPRSFARRIWNVPALAPGSSHVIAQGYERRQPLPPAALDVPLELWTNGNYPGGLDFGKSTGISFGDYDHDGFIDVVASTSGNLWHNDGGTTWTLATNINQYLPKFWLRYSMAFGDYDNDALPDVGTEPRLDHLDECMHLLHNLGGAVFDDVADDPNVVDVQPCGSNTETLCIADTDGNGNLDWFLPGYPPGAWNSLGNWFLCNDGPTGPGGAYHFTEMSAAAGLDNPDNTPGPEGAMFADVDADGDVDLYSNGTVYQNRSTLGVPLFGAMSGSGSGITDTTSIDEGAVWADYDMDGDPDLLIEYVYGTVGIAIWENRGDGQFFLVDSSVIDRSDLGINEGLSCADWDNDGDLDFTTKDVFRRNMLLEEGKRHFIVATHDIDPANLTNATPAWGDWDKDGDLDTALGNAGKDGHLYENTLYDTSTPMDQRRFVRVRCVRDSATHDEGLETEYGAAATVRPLGVSDDGHVRRNIVSSSNGYLNQGEYTLHFGLPPDPVPDDPDEDLQFEVTVDFKGAHEQGTWRVDRHVNPILGSVDLAHLDDREIVVYRSGRVRLNGVDFLPSAPTQPLWTTTDSLALADSDTPLPAPIPAPTGDWFVGVELSTAAAIAPLRVEELVLDGQLDKAIRCDGEPVNVFVWDVTDPTAPELVSGGAQLLRTRIRDDRNTLRCDVVLAPGRVYRCVARVSSLRASPIAGPLASGPITTNGGLSFQDASPCAGAAATAAALDPNRVYLALRFRNQPHCAWFDAGHALGGKDGDPKLVGHGNLDAGTNTTFDLTNAPPSAPLWAVFGISSACLPFAGGVIVPSLDVILGGQTTDANGLWSISGVWPDGVPGGTTFWCQTFSLDVDAPKGVAISNAVGGTSPY